MFIKTFLITALALFTLSAQANNYFQGDGVISYVVDGDTMDIRTSRENLNNLLNRNLVSEEHVNFSRNTFRVRLANIDTDESVHVDASQNTQRGIEISNYVKNMTTNQQTVFNCYDKGYYGRSICSITVNNEDLGYHLIKNGYSSYLTDFGNHPTMHWHYRRAQAEYLANQANKHLQEKGIGERINNFRINLLN